MTLLQLLIYSPVGKPLANFQWWAAVDSVAVNIWVLVLWGTQTCISAAWNCWDGLFGFDSGLVRFLGWRKTVTF